MVTVIAYLLIAGIVGVVIFLLASIIFGRGEQLAPLPVRTSPTQVPESNITAADVHRLRFGVALRGYRMSDVDFALDRLAQEIDSLNARITTLSEAPHDVP